MLLRELRNAKNSNFDNSESALYSTSGSMPLTENRVGRNEILCAEDNHSFVCPCVTYV